RRHTRLQGDWSQTCALPIFSPIHRITQTAQAIGAERNFNRRVQHAGPGDEVGQLAVTFNTMLTELESAYHQLEQTLDSQRRFVRSEERRVGKGCSARWSLRL